VSVRFLIGDVREKLRELADESVHCVVTSPPYFGLRDYGTAQWEGGDPACDHTNARRGHGEHEKQSTSAGTSRDSLAGARECRRCGARRIDSQIGLEESPALYVAELVAVFREVRRVLRRDGCAFVVIGDSYASSGVSGKQSPTSNLSRHGGKGFNPKMMEQSFGRAPTPPGLKPKDRMMIPARVALALQSDGWWLRDEIVWHKPNAMPSSVQDRTTSAHEMVYLLTKSATYAYDAAAISEPLAESTVRIHSSPSVNARGSGADWKQYNVGNGHSGLVNGNLRDGTRNRRSVWTIATEPSSLGHFALMPTALAELCIKAGCPADGTVLDPFGGAGTTGLVADRLGRNAILIELSPAYATMARRRLERDAGMFMVAAE
jgi:DNA modification methylase